MAQHSSTAGLAPLLVLYAARHMKCQFEWPTGQKSSAQLPAYHSVRFTQAKDNDHLGKLHILLIPLTL